MPDCFDLLTEPLIGIRAGSLTLQVTLPEVLARLSGGGLDAYTGQRAHQTDPWHVLTVQLAASILARRPELKHDQPPDDPGFWRDGLFDLADGQASAWRLLEADSTRAAFMQHPLFGASELAEKFRPKAATPDELDIPVTSKNHDLKIARVRTDDVESWLYALVLYQTTSGFFGNGNYGAARMNSGTGSRPVVSVVASMNPSLRFRAELARVCAYRGVVLAKGFGYCARGTVLTWLRPWDRSGHQWTPSQLEPWYAEACRPLRLVATDRGIAALGATSQARQIGPKMPDGGDVGDPWIPINAENKKGRTALTVGPRGWTPALVTSLLFEDGYEASPMQVIPEGSGDLIFTASVLARGQGSTEGFHRLELPIPARVRPRLFQREERGSLGKSAQSLLSDANELRSAVRMALTLLTEGGPDKPDTGAVAVTRWVDSRAARLEQGWSRAFFDHLWRSADEDAEAVRREWRAQLLSLGLATLERALQDMPRPSNRRWRARVRAEGALTAMLRKKGWTFATTQEEFA
jgi:CRISPR system Cascade subunit CasA